MSRARHSGRLVADGGTEFVTECDSKESTVCAVSRSLAAIRDVAETDLDPLYTKMDFEAMDRMLEHADRQGCPVRVTFRIEGHDVLVREDGSIRIDPDFLPPISTDRK